MTMQASAKVDARPHCRDVHWAAVLKTALNEENGRSVLLPVSATAGYLAKGKQPHANVTVLYHLGSRDAGRQAGAARFAFHSIHTTGIALVPCDLFPWEKVTNPSAASS